MKSFDIIEHYPGYINLGMEIRQLRYFLDIAETEHLTQSAQNLFVTQSTLSHGLRQLEQELDVALFDRLGRGLKLSQAGAEFRVYARRALQEIEAGRMALADLGGLQSGQLKVGAFPTFLNTVVPATPSSMETATFSGWQAKSTIAEPITTWRCRRYLPSSCAANFSASRAWAGVGSRFIARAIS